MAVSTFRPRGINAAWVLPLVAVAIWSISSAQPQPPPLQGTKLRCCTVPEPPLVIENVTEGENSLLGYGGIAIDYLQKLQDWTGMECDTLINYEPDSVNGTDDSEVEGNATQISGGNEFDNFIIKLTECTVKNEEGNGVINNTDKTCVCDLGVGAWALNEKRLGLVDFLPPYVFDSFYVVTHIDNTIPDAGIFFLRTFSSTVWGTVFALLLVFTLLKFIDTSFAPWTKETDDTRNSSFFSRLYRYISKGRTPYRFRKSLQSTSTFTKSTFSLCVVGTQSQILSDTILVYIYAVGHMMGVPSADIDGEFGTFRQDFLNFVIFLCGLFLILIYGSSMTASIVQESFGSDYRDINDFKLCRIPTEDICLLGGDGVEQFWNLSIAKSECHREEGFISPRVFPSENFTAALDATAEKNCTYLVGLGSTLRYEIDLFYCGTLVLTGDPFFDEGVRFVLPLGSNLTKPLTRATLALKNRDDVGTVGDFFDDDEGCLPLRPKSLTFTKLSGFFYLAFGACGLLLLEMLIDRRVFRPRRADETDETPDQESGETSVGNISPSESKQQSSL